MKNDKMMKIITKDGLEKEYKIICAFSLSNTGKNYIVYTDDSKNSKGETQLYASIYYPDDDTRLEEITSDEEWKIIENILNELKEVKE